MWGGRGTIRLMRVFLYVVIFGLFVVLFSVFGNVQIDGQEYFSPRPYVIPILAVLALSVLVIGFLTWRIHVETQKEVEKSSMNKTKAI